MEIASDNNRTQSDILRDTSVNEFDKLPLESVDTRMISFMRMLLAFSAIIVTYIDPTEPNRFVEITYTTLILYCFYSGGLYLLSIKKPSLSVFNFVHWIDIGWYLILISLSQGTNSIFFFFFFFSILIASFGWGFNSGLKVTLISATLFTIIGYFAAPTGDDFELNRFLLRPIYLAILGYMVSYWGGEEIKFIKRLAFLKEVNKLSNPRFGIDQTLASIMDRLLDFFGCDCGSLIIKSTTSADFSLREASLDEPNKALSTEVIRKNDPLLKLADSNAIFFQNKSSYIFKERKQFAIAGRTGERIEIPKKTFSALADILNAESFITVPIYQRDEMFGRLYLTSQKCVFERSDVEFLRQLMDHIMPVIENIDLLNRLASEAAEQQRQKISRDIHDSTIQPYIGLKLGLEALEMKCSNGESITEDVQKLIEIADNSIADLRSFVRKLKGETEDRPGSVLITAVQQQAAKFYEFYAIKVNVESADGFRLNDRLAAEAFQIITESLSNIKRHTTAKNATIKIYNKSGKLFIEVENDNESTQQSPDFIPKSITGRSEALGGAAKIIQSNSLTKVIVEIPL